MKLRTILFVLALTILESSAFPQSYFREGYIEKKSGEVFRGLIKYKVNQKIPDRCIFKRFDIAREVVYDPEELKAFGYKDGNRYESVEIKNKVSFYEVLVLGNITLYCKGSDYYVKKGHSSLTRIETSHIKYVEPGNEKEFDNLQSFLSYLTDGKVGELNDRFNIKKDLLPLIVSYNKVSGNDSYTFNRTMTDKQFAKEISLSDAKKNRYGLLSGINIYNLNIELSPNAPISMNSSYVPDPKKETSLITGITYERVLLRKSDKLSLRADLLYSNQNFYWYSESSTIISTSRHDVLFNITALKVPVLLQYNFTGKRIVPYINAGVAYQFFLSDNYLHIEEKENLFNEVSTFEDRNFTFKPGELSGAAGIGLRLRFINNISLNLQTRIEYGSGPFVSSLPENFPDRKFYKNLYNQNSLQYNLFIGITF